MATHSETTDPWHFGRGPGRGIGRGDASDEITNPTKRLTISWSDAFNAMESEGRRSAWHGDPDIPNLKQ